MDKVLRTITITVLVPLAGLFSNHRVLEKLATRPRAEPVEEPQRTARRRQPLSPEQIDAIALSVAQMQRGRSNIVQARSFSEMLAQAIQRYQNRAIEAAEWRTYRAEAAEGNSGAISEVASARDGSHSTAPKGFDQNGPLPRQAPLKYRHIPALAFLALGHFASNLDGAVYEFTA